MLKGSGKAKGKKKPRSFWQRINNFWHENSSLKSISSLLLFSHRLPIVFNFLLFHLIDGNGKKKKWKKFKLRETDRYVYTAPMCLCAAIYHSPVIVIRFSYWLWPFCVLSLCFRHSFQLSFHSVLFGVSSQDVFCAKFTFNSVLALFCGKTCFSYDFTLRCLCRCVCALPCNERKKRSFSFYFLQFS